MNLAKHHAIISINESIQKLSNAGQWDLVAKAQDWRFAVQGETCKPREGLKAVNKLLERM